MILAEGVSKVIDMLRSDDPAVSSGAMAVVANMSNDEGCRRMIAASGGIPFVISMLDPNSERLDGAADAACNLLNSGWWSQLL